MKKTIFFLFAAFVLQISFAQKGKVISALNAKEAGKLKQAIETIHTSIDPTNEKSAKSINWPRTWEVKGEIYQAIFHSEKEEIIALCEEPLTVALNAYKKAIELDEKDKFLKSIKIKLTLLSNSMLEQGAQAFNNEDFELALKSFEQILEINQLLAHNSGSPATIDTAIIYNAGMMAFKTEDFDKAVEYFEETANLGYNGANSCLWLSRVYEQKKDTASALLALKNGFEKYPNDTEVLSNLIQMYLDLDKQNEAKELLELAIEKEPENARYYVAMGSLYDKNGDYKNAINYYQKAIGIDSELFLAHFNLGVIYYNQGVQLFDEAKNIPSNENEAYEKALKEIDNCWEKALPYMEKCYHLKPTDNSVIESLKSLYYRLNQMDKYKAIESARAR